MVEDSEANKESSATNSTDEDKADAGSDTEPSGDEEAKNESIDYINQLLDADSGSMIKKDSEVKSETKQFSTAFPTVDTTSNYLSNAYQNLPGSAVYYEDSSEETEDEDDPEIDEDAEDSTEEESAEEDSTATNDSTSGFNWY